MKNTTLLNLCRKELEFLIRDYSCRVRSRRFGFGTPAIIFKQRLFSLEVYYDELDNALFMHLSPVRFGLTLIWKRIDVEAIFLVKCPGRTVDRGSLDDLRTDEYYRRVLRSFGMLLQECASDYLSGDFSGLRETRERLNERSKERSRRFTEEMRRELDLRKQQKQRPK